MKSLNLLNSYNSELDSMDMAVMNIKTNHAK